MKKLTLILTLFIAFSNVNAQKVLNAYNYYKDGQLDKAKKEIDECMLNDKNNTQAKTWFYRGNIYLKIFLTNNTNSFGIVDEIGRAHV